MYILFTSLHVNWGLAILVNGTYGLGFIAPMTYAVVRAAVHVTVVTLLTTSVQHAEIFGRGVTALRLAGTAGGMANLMEYLTAVP